MKEKESNHGISSKQSKTLKIMLLFFIATILSLTFALSGCADKTPELVIPEVVEFEIVDGALLSYNGSGGDVVVPSEVTSIKSGTFANRPSITSLTIPSSVVSIGTGILKGATGVISLNIPYVGAKNPTAIATTGMEGNIGYLFGSASTAENATVVPQTLTKVTVTGSTIIPNDAFINASSIEEIILPNSIEDIGTNAMKGCNSLTNVTIPFIGSHDVWSSTDDNVINVFGYLFGATSSTTNGDNVPSTLKSVMINGGTVTKDSNGVEIIPEHAFANISSIETIGFNANAIKEIGSYAFEKFDGIETLVLPDTIESIGISAFADMEKLKSITFGSKLTYVGNAIFAYSSAIEEVLMPIDSSNYFVYGNTLISNEGTAVAGCKKSTFPTSGTVKKIGQDAFRGQTFLSEIELPSSIYEIGMTAFMDCTSLAEINTENVTSILTSALSNCSSLRELDLRSASIGTNALSGTSSLNTVTVFLNSSNKFKEFFNNSVPTSILTVKIVDKVSSAGAVTNVWVNPSEFSGLSHIRSIQIESASPTIGVGAFAGTSLTSLAVPLNSSGLFVSYFTNAAGVSASLKTVTITGGPYVGSNAFEGLTQIETINLPEDGLLTQIYANAFNGCSGLTSINIPSSITRIDAAAFTGTSIKYLEIPDTVASISRSAFSGANLVEVSLPYFGTREYDDIDANSDSDYQHFGAIFGVEDAKLNYSSVPTSLKTVTIRNGDYVPHDAFYKLSSITTINLPAGVTVIGDNAFNGCSAVTALDINNNVTKIGENALAGTASLTSISLPFIGNGTDEVTHFGYIFGATTFEDHSGVIPEKLATVTISGGTVVTENAFNGINTGASKITLPDTIASIEDNAFKGFTSLTSIQLGSSLVTIGNSAFEGATKLTSITFPATLESIGDFAFTGCTYFETVIINGTSSLKTIGESAFASNSNFVNFTLPSSLESIGESAFYKTKLTGEVVLSDAITVINNNTFQDTKITSLTANSSALITIEEYAFSGCSSLASVVLSNSITTIETYAFSGAGVSSINIPNALTAMGTYAFKDTKFSQVTIPSTLSVIPEGAFENSYLSQINFPSSITQIGENSFRGSSITTISFSDNSELVEICAEAFASTSSLTSAVIPSTTQTIGLNIFKSCTSLYSLSIPFIGAEQAGDTAPAVETGILKTYMFGSSSSLPISELTVTSETYIIDEAFIGSPNLKKVIFEGNIKDGIIGDKAFYQLYNLDSIEFNNSVVKIGDNAFDNCTILKELEFYDGLETVGNESFARCYALQSLVIPQTVESIGTSILINNNSINSLEIPFIGPTPEADSNYPYFGYVYGRSGSAPNASKLNSLRTVVINSDTSIPNNAFFQEVNISSITFKGNIQNGTIGDYAFSNTNMTSFTVPDGVTHIGEEAFKNSNGITSISMPTSIEEIGDSAFYNIVNLVTIDFYDTKGSVSNGLIIGDYAFYQTSFTNISLPNFTTEIGSYAFANSKLTSLNIPSGTTDICASAFRSSQSLESVTFDNGVLANIGEYVFADTALTSLVIPSTVTSIGQYALSGLDNMTTLSIPVFPATDSAQLTLGSLYGKTIGQQNDIKLENITITGSTKIAESCFMNVSSLQTVTFDGAVITDGTIGSTAFNGTNVTTLNFPTSLTEIGNSSFKGNTTISEISGEGINTIGESAFEGCTSLSSFDFTTVSSLGASAFKNTALNKITLPSTLTAIPNNAFENCISLTTVGYGNSLTSIGASAFAGCSSLVSLGTSSDDFDIIIAESVSSIGAYALKGISENVTSISILNNEATIGASALEGLKITKASLPLNNISFVTIIGGVSLASSSIIEEISVTSSANIMAECFRGLTHLNTVTLPTSGLTQINTNAFNSTSITELVVPDSVTTFVANSLAGMNKLIELTIPFVGLTSADVSSTINTLLGTTPPATLKEVSITTATSINNMAFKSNTSIEKVTISDSTTTIGSDAFNGCTSLSSFNFPNTLTSIGTGAFSYTKLVEVDLSNVESNLAINSESFQYITTLTKFITSDNITLNERVLTGCTGLVHLEIGNVAGTFAAKTGLVISTHESLEYIVLYGSTSLAGFENTSALKALIIYGTSTNIYGTNFSNASSIEYLYFSSNITGADSTAMAGVSADCVVDLQGTATGFTAGWNNGCTYTENVSTHKTYDELFPSES